KRSLASALENESIVYKHIPAMGCPKNVRERYKLDQDWTLYTEGFLAHLSVQPAALADIVTIAKASSSCLVCFEADFNRCHRIFVARAAARSGHFQVRHLTSQTVIPEEAVRSAA